MAQFLIGTKAEDTIQTIVVAGEFDLAAVAPFADAASEVLEAQPELVVVDLRRLTYLGSSGLAELVKLHKRAGAETFRLALLRPPPRVSAVFELTGLGRELPLFDPDRMPAIDFVRPR